MADSPYVLKNPALAPFDDAAAVAPNDGADLPGGICRGLFIGGAGNLNVDTSAGTTITLTGVPVGILNLRVRRVRATSTTATNIAALY